MRHNGLAHRLPAQVRPVLWSSDDVLHNLQTTLAAIADIECQYELDSERLEQWTGPEAAKARLRAELQSRRDQSREPLLRTLDECQQRVRALIDPGR